MAQGNILRVEFVGEFFEVQDRLTFGRAGDLEIDTNQHLHRLVGEFVREGEVWWLRNLGSRLFITLTGVDGTRVDLAPGASQILVVSKGSVRISVGPARYEILFESDGLAPPDTSELSRSDGSTTEFRAFLTPREVDFLVTFARPILDGTNGPLPSYADVAKVWGVSIKTLDNTVQSFKRKMRNARLARDEPLDTIVRVAIAHSLVSQADLEWASLQSANPRPASAGPRFNAT